MHAFVVYCGTGRLSETASSKPYPKDDQHSLIRRPALVGAVPLYYLMRAGQKLRATLPSLVEHVQEQSRQVNGSVTNNLMKATEDALAELAAREAEIAVLKAECRNIKKELERSNQRNVRLSQGKVDQELSHTASRFEQGMLAASCRAVRAEREVEKLSALIRGLERDIQMKSADSVKINAAIGTFAFVMFAFWTQLGNQL